MRGKNYKRAVFQSKYVISFSKNTLSCDRNLFPAEEKDFLEDIFPLWLKFVSYEKRKFPRK